MQKNIINPTYSKMEKISSLHIIVNISHSAKFVRRPQRERERERSEVGGGGGRGGRYGGRGVQGIERKKWEILSLHKIVNINHSAKCVMGNLVPAQNSIKSVTQRNV